LQGSRRVGSNRGKKHGGEEDEIEIEGKRPQHPI